MFLKKYFFLARKKIKNGPFLESSDLMNPIGCNSDQLKDILLYCGYFPLNLFDGKKLYFFKNNKKTIKKNNKNKLKKRKIKSDNTPKTKADQNSPFAVLEKLL